MSDAYNAAACRQGAWPRRLTGGLVAVLCLASAACGSSSATPASPATPSVTASAPAGHAATPHGDHSPHHGGSVLMHGDLHYEIVLPRDGGAQLHLTDELRQDLPASVVSNVVIEIARRGASPETLELSPHSSGAYWAAPGHPVTAPDALVRVGFAYDGRTVSVELPYEAYFAAPSAAAAAPPAPGARR